MSTMQPPEKPGPFDCCGQGCIPCVYDLYAEELRHYEEWRALQGNSEQAQKNEAGIEDEPEGNENGEDVS